MILYQAAEGRFIGLSKLKILKNSLFGFLRPAPQRGQKQLLNMSNEEFQFLNLRHWPARLNAEQTALVLNCRLHDIWVLISEGLITPLGKPAQNGKKYFETKAILEATQDRRWLIKATEAIRIAWKTRNGNAEESKLAA
jgi:hypothetical protein